MVYTDPIADMLSRIRNAILVNQNTVTMPHSKMKQTVAEQLVKANFIEAVTVDGEAPHKTMQIQINAPGSNARITAIEKVSKPGRRIYASVDDIPTVKNGRGVVIVSTSRGVMSGSEAKKNKVGGELICKVY